MFYNDSESDSNDNKKHMLSEALCLKFSHVLSDASLSCFTMMLPCSLCASFCSKFQIVKNSIKNEESIWFFQSEYYLGPKK